MTQPTAAGAFVAVPSDLLWLSHELGDPARGWAILGEGNTSCHCDAETFFVKASGTQLGKLAPEHVVQVDRQTVLSALGDTRSYTDGEIKELLREAAMYPPQVVPSVETLLHAYLLTLPGVNYVGHTHVTAIISIVSTVQGWAFLESGLRLFPDEVVVCGIAPCCVPYVDPGLPLARELVFWVQAYMNEYGSVPKTIYLQNHGVIALGSSAVEVLNVSLMANKAANVLLSALAVGSVQPLTAEQASRIAGRPDEHHRQRMLGLS